jgi:hypothetical protein
MGRDHMGDQEAERKAILKRKRVRGVRMLTAFIYKEPSDGLNLRAP